MDMKRKDIEKKVKGIIYDILDPYSSKKVSLDDSIENDLGFDSLDCLTLEAQLGNVFGIKINRVGHKIIKRTTVKGVIDYIESKL